MILFSIGMPGRFAAWCDATVVRMIERGLGAVESLSARSPDDIAIALLRARAPHLAITSRRPAPSLCTLLAGTAAPRIVALDDPRRVLRDLIAEQGIDIRAATREVARCCAAAVVCAGLPGAVTVHARDGAVAASLARACGLDEVEADRIPAPHDGDPIETWWAALDPGDRALAEGALGAYVDKFAGGEMGDLVWDRTLFWHAAEPDRHAAGTIDMGDQAGRLLSGPEIELPAGSWLATVALAVSKEVVGIGFDIEVWAADRGDPLARSSIIADPRGLCSATLAFGVEAPTAQAIRFSIANTAPAPGGRLALGNVTLTPSRGDGSDIPSELATVFGL